MRVIVLVAEEWALNSILERGWGCMGAHGAWVGKVPLCPASFSHPPRATAQDLKRLLPPRPIAGQGVHLHYLGNSNLSF